jgi:hypothetical protein
MGAMMALDAAGVPINQVLRDGKTRMEAIEAYGGAGAGTLRELLAVLLS